MLRRFPFQRTLATVCALSPTLQVAPPLLASPSGMLGGKNDSFLTLCLRFLLWGAVSLLSVGTAAAGVTVNILWGPFPGKTQRPNYASGTRCEVVAHISTNTSGAYLTRVKLRIGGETLIDQTPYPMPYVYLNVRFASTHFPDGTNLEVYAEGSDSRGQTGSASRYVQVYNKATVYGRYEWERDPSAPTAGVPPSSERLAYTNHSVLAVWEQGWTKQMVLNDIAPCTVFYVNTHGNVGFFTSDADELTGIPEPIYPGDVLPVRQVAVGTGYPPFNTGLPPISLVFIDACYTGWDNSFNVFLYPYYNAYNTNWCENQALVGWRETVNADRTRVCGYAFWGALAAGWTVHQARDEMVRTYWYPKSIPPGHERDHASVWGDYHARLYGVYTGTDDFSPHFWW